MWLWGFGGRFLHELFVLENHVAEVLSEFVHVWDTFDARQGGLERLDARLDFGEIQGFVAVLHCAPLFLRAFVLWDRRDGRRD